jgi:hypothetical protein
MIITLDNLILISLGIPAGLSIFTGWLFVRRQKVGVAIASGLVIICLLLCSIESWYIISLNQCEAESPGPNLCGEWGPLILFGGILLAVIESVIFLFFILLVSWAFKLIRSHDDLAF